MVLMAVRTFPFSNRYVFHGFVLKATVRTKLAGREPLVDFDNGCTTTQGNIFQNLKEFAVPIVTGLLTVPDLHEFKIQRFEADSRIFAAKLGKISKLAKIFKLFNAHTRTYYSK
jgi:hypothetical protein